MLECLLLEMESPIIFDDFAYALTINLIANLITQYLQLLLKTIGFFELMLCNHFVQNLFKLSQGGT